MLSAGCPECGETVRVDEHLRAGGRVISTECGIELELLSLYPLEFDYVLEADPDDDLYDDDEWDGE